MLTCLLLSAPGLSLNFATKGQTTFSFGMPVDAAGAAASPAVSTIDTSKPPMQQTTFSFGSTAGKYENCPLHRNVSQQV